MKASALKVRSQSNIDETDDIEMSFDVKGQAKLAAILIDLYSDLWSAIIREYAANGWDSHVSAGQKRPIELTLPSIKDPVFRVKDYGVGMSLEDIREIYSKYGASTKDMDNDQIGAYGLGCKSALSVSPAFTVTAVKNGVKTVVIVSREENSLGKIKPVMQVDTDEANGVEVSIAIDADIKEFEEKAAQVFFTWPKGSVLINGKPPVKSIYDAAQFLHLGNEAYMSHKRSTTYYSDDTKGLLINMGGIGYPVNDQQYSVLLDTAHRRGSVSRGSIAKHKLVLTVPLGSVDLVPSREGIRWSQKSTDTVVTKLKQTMGLVVSSIQKKIDVIENRADLFSAEIFDLGQSFPSYFTSGDLKWKGEEFPKKLGFETTVLDDEITASFASTYHQSRRHKGYYGGVQFNFGFNEDTSNVEFKDSKRGICHHWIFVDCKENTATATELHHHVKSLMKARRINEGSVTVVYVVNDLLTSNKWISTLIENKGNNVSSLTAEELIEESKAYRKEQSRLNRMNKKVTETVYTVSVVAEQNSRKSRIDTVLTASEMEKMITDNPKLQIFADEVIFSTANKEHAGSAMFFIPEDVIIVYMRGARKASTFEKKVNFPVRTDLPQFLAECMIEKIEQVEFKDYFYELHLSYDMCNFGNRLDIPEGFLRECFGNERPGRNVARSLLSNMNTVKQITGAVFPEIPYVVKSRQVSELGSLFFEDPQPWSMATRSSAYKEQMGIYLSGISDKIDMVVNG